MSNKPENKVTTASVSSYFSNNLQQIGFSSPTKAVLTTLKEALDNSLDACEEAGILPSLKVIIEKQGTGTMKNAEKIRILVEDNGPGIPKDIVDKVFGEFLASSKFGRGRCTRGQQGLGISSSVAWAQLTNARGVQVITKTKKDKKALSCIVEVDIKNNRGLLKEEKMIDWDRDHGTSVEFLLDGKVQINGEAGLLTYLQGTCLVNPHLSLRYTLPDSEEVVVERVSNEVIVAPESVNPHPHTMKLGEFISHGHLYHGVKTKVWLKDSFSRIADSNLSQLDKAGYKAVLNKTIDQLNEAEYKGLFKAIQDLTLQPPSTRSLMNIGEDSLSKSIQRIGDVDFFAVVTRKPSICDFKPVQIEVAIARLSDKGGNDTPIQVLRFANRVPLQFDKKADVSVQAIESVNWKAYGLAQPKESLPVGPYILAVSIVSPFIKFKNASKETIDASDELLEEIRLTLIQAGQKLSKYIKKETKANELEEKLRHIEMFTPILIDSLMSITDEPKVRRQKLEKGLSRILGRDTADAEEQLAKAETSLSKQKEKDQTNEG